MRLTEHERHTLISTIRAADPDATLWLFGSRVDDHALGGDIDVLVMSQRMRLSEKLDVLARLHTLLGEQKIDLTIARDDSRPFIRLAKAGGIQL
ncbi:nucleotidyltransferase domain-containing protein [Leptothrix ochracea]|uniref:nucleotidyltransferase domain-containing protein n=1 Tax=Leptothrix ochracea TaxID=735331 RepID=UPI0034E1D848